MVTTKKSFLVVLILMAMGMLGVLLILAASAAPAATLPVDQIYVSPAYVSQSEASNVLSEADTRAVVVADTRSMEPTLVAGNQVIEKEPQSATEIVIGDIITFASTTKGVTLIHRVVAISSDDYGWYATTKGDNSPNVDVEKVRFPMVKGIVVAIVK